MHHSIRTKSVAYFPNANYSERNICQCHGAVSLSHHPVHYINLDLGNSLVNYLIVIVLGSISVSGFFPNWFWVSVSNWKQNHCMRKKRCRLVKWVSHTFMCKRTYAFNVAWVDELVSERDHSKMMIHFRLFLDFFLAVWLSPNLCMFSFALLLLWSPQAMTCAEADWDIEREKKAVYLVFQFKINHFGWCCLFCSVLLFAFFHSPFVLLLSSRWIKGKTIKWQRIIISQKCSEKKPYTNNHRNHIMYARTDERKNICIE